MRNMIIGIICTIMQIIVGVIKIVYGVNFDTKLASMIYDIASGCVVATLGVVGLGFFLGCLSNYKKARRN